MLRAVIADTDLDNIRNFKTFIRTSFPDIKIFGTLSDTTADIFASVRELSPQLIIADIRFFGPVSYNTIRELHDRHPDLRFVLYGTYNDGEYMKRCRDYGVLDYLFRPVKPGELNRVLHEVQRYFLKEDERKKEEQTLVASYKERLFLFEDIFINSVIHGQLRDDKEIRYAFHYFNIELGDSCTAFILRIDHFQKVILTIDEMEKHMLIYKLFLMIREKLRHVQSLSVISGFNTVTTILGGEHELDELLTLCEEIKNEARDRTGIRVTVGIGRTYPSPSDICISYKEANAALRYRFYVGYNAVIPIHFVEPMNNITYRYPIEREERLVYTAVIGEYALCHTLIRELFDSLRDCGPLPDKLLPKIIMDILISINRYLSEQNIPLQKQFTTFFPSKDALEIKDIDQAISYLDNAIKKFCESILAFREESNDRMFEAARSYVHDRYYESFSLPKIARYAESTPEYINKLFVDREKKSLLDYTVTVRMNEAKRLMRESELDDDMIAIKIGYEDGRHFKSVFRQRAGVSTADYRAQYNLYDNRA